MNYKALSPSEKWIIRGVPVLFLFGSLMHFLYDLSGGNVIVGMFAPVNESVWEHLKMVLLPVVCWWTIYFVVERGKYSINKNKWFTGSLAALLTALITIPLLYYFYTEAFGTELLAVDIIILFFALLFGQLVGLHFYKYTRGINSSIAICILTALIILFIIFTFFPPGLPLFQDASKG